MSRVLPKNKEAALFLAERLFLIFLTRCSMGLQALVLEQALVP
jgi:hypothetical protein